METRETETFVVKFENTPEMAEKVFKKLIDWYFEQESFMGECIMQCDNSIIEAPEVLSEIADDIIKFDVDYKD